MSKRKSAVHVTETRAPGKQRLLDDPHQDPTLDADSDSDAALADVLEGLADDAGDDIGNDALLDGMSAETDDDGIQQAIEQGLGDDDDFKIGVQQADDASAAAAAAEAREQREAAAVAAEEAQAIADTDVELPLDAATLQTCESLDLSTLSVSCAQARRIAPILCGNASLTVIRFAGHDLSIGDLREEDELEWDSEEFTDLEAIIIAEFLKRNLILKRLDLARNQISDDGARALARALMENTVLEYLNLESNLVAETGGNALGRAIKANTTLQYLNVMYNAIPSAAQQVILTPPPPNSALSFHPGRSFLPPMPHSLPCPSIATRILTPRSPPESPLDPPPSTLLPSPIVTPHPIPHPTPHPIPRRSLGSERGMDAGAPRTAGVAFAVRCVFWRTWVTKPWIDPRVMTLPKRAQTRPPPPPPAPLPR